MAAPRQVSASHRRPRPGAVAALPTLAYHHLTRYLAVANALERALAGASGRVLDVGGYPGTFAKFAPEAGRVRQIHTCDVVEADLKYYHRTRPGEPLPFEAGAFDAVLTID